MSLSRRGLLAAAAGGAATIAAGCGDTETEARDDPPAGDLEVVRYALLLEQLEYAFYQQVVDAGILSGREGALAVTIEENERQHVLALGAVVRRLGRRTGPTPPFDFSQVLSGGRDSVIATAAELENTGAGAYLQEAARISDPDILASALAIHAIEARHAAVLNRLAGLPGLPDGAFATPLRRPIVLARIEPFLA